MVMRYRELIGQSYSGRPLKEAPQDIGPVDFITSEAHRDSFAEMLLSRRPQVVLEDEPGYELRRGGDERGSVIYFFMLEKPSGKLVYFAECETHDAEFLGHAVTQVALWRDDTSTAVRGITERVFFDYLLSAWPSVVSDEQQTRDGKAFWIRRMAIAVERGYRVGLVDMRDQTIDWCEEPFRQWIAAHADAWGPSYESLDFRFIISRAIW